MGQVEAGIRRPRGRRPAPGRAWGWMVVAPLLTGCQLISDLSDRTALRRQARIPPEAEILRFDGFPWSNGFGQREGLVVRGTYRIPDGKRTAFEASLRSGDWAPLPIDPAVRKRLVGWERTMAERELPRKGYYRCHTAGNNVLHAPSTRPCTTAPLLEYRVPLRDSDGRMRLDAQGQPLTELSHRGLNDLILTSYDPATGRLEALVASGY